MIDDKWEKLKFWLMEQKERSYFARDAYRYTAYEAALEKMITLEDEDER